MSDDAVPRPGQDEPEILWVLETADSLRRVLHSSQMRPAFRERLRAQLLEAHAETITAATAVAEAVGPAPTVVAPVNVAPTVVEAVDVAPTVVDAVGPAPAVAEVVAQVTDATPAPPARAEPPASVEPPTSAEPKAPPEPPATPPPLRALPTLPAPQEPPATPPPLRALPTLPGQAAPPATVRRRGSARRFTRPRVLALAGAVAAMLAVAAIVVVRGLPTPGRPSGPVSVTAQADAAGAVSNDPTEALRLRFSQALDQKATEAAVHLSPAVKVRFSWQGNTLTVSPDHGFAPNAAYVLTIAHNAARTATGAPLSGDIHVAFGTAPVPGVGHAAGPAVPLDRAQVAVANDDSEAVIARTGALLLTDARPSRATDQHTGLVRLENGTAFKISGATPAICVSRTGNSIAYLTPAGQRTQIVLANGIGTAQRQFAATVDDGSPLGWIGDAEVSFVSGGRLSAVDRNGHVRVLSDVPVDVAHDSLVLSPGGRYAYVRHGSDASGQVIDLQTGKTHPLAAADTPAFSADGATVVWVDASGAAPRLAVAASGGGPVLTAPLPVRPGDRLSDLSVSPDTARFAYSVTHTDGTAELRLAALPDGETLAVSAGAGASPNWSASGHEFTVLSQAGTGPQIDLVTVPGSVLDPGASFEAAAATFAYAQVSGDGDAQRSLAAAGVTVPELPQVTRATVLWVQESADGTATARVRLTVDAPAGQVAVRQAEETLTLGPATGGGPPVVRAVAAEPFGPAPDGPQLVQLDTDARPGTALLTFDSDLDPATVAAGVTLTTPDGTPVAATASYDAATRTVALRPAAASTAPVVVHVAGGLRDVAGHGPSGELRIPTTLAA